MGLLYLAKPHFFAPISYRQGMGWPLSAVGSRLAMYKCLIQLPFKTPELSFLHVIQWHTLLYTLLYFWSGNACGFHPLRQQALLGYRQDRWISPLCRWSQPHTVQQPIQKSFFGSCLMRSYQSMLEGKSTKPIFKHTFPFHTNTSIFMILQNEERNTDAAETNSPLLKHS